MYEPVIGDRSLVRWGIDNGRSLYFFFYVENIYHSGFNILQLRFFQNSSEMMLLYRGLRVLVYCTKMCMHNGLVGNLSRGLWFHTFWNYEGLTMKSSWMRWSRFEFIRSYLSSKEFFYEFFGEFLGNIRTNWTENFSSRSFYYFSKLICVVVGYFSLYINQSE